MLVSCMVFAALAAHAAAPMVFLSPEDLADPHGITLEAQLPQPGMTLFAKNPDRPKLWYAPVAVMTDDGGARIWYQRVNKDEQEFSDQRTLCIGEIRDGAWKLVPASAEAPAWGGVNNVCLRRSPFTPTWGGFNVFQMAKVGEGYKLLYWDQPDEAGQAGAMLASSGDGVIWNKEPGGTVFTEFNDAFTLLPDDGRFLLYQTALEDWPDKPYPDNLDKKRRILTLRRSGDLKTWTPQEVFLKPDAQDPPETEFYLMKAFRYGGGVLGVIMKYYADPAAPEKHSALLKYELVASRDGVQWTRPFRATDVGFWSYANPFPLQDRLHFAIWKDGAMATVSYAPHRVIAVCAGEEEGSFSTASIEAKQPVFKLDGDAQKGWIEVRLLDGSGQPVRGVEAKRMEAVDKEDIAVDFSGAAGEGPYRLGFRMRNAKVFAVSAAGGH